MTSSSTVAASPDRTPVRAARAFRPSRFATLCLAIGAVSLIAPQVSAAPPPVTVNQPVKVEVVNPVDVVGAVEVIGPVEVLNLQPKIPYIQQLSGTIASSVINEIVTFTNPNGKCLVTETVTVGVHVPDGASAYGWLSVGGHGENSNTAFAYLTMTYQGPSREISGGSFYTANMPMTLRIDPSRNFLLAVIYRVGGSGRAIFDVSIFGYLEDL